MAGAFVQSKGASSAIDGETVTATLDSTATSGNILIAFLAIDKNSVSVDALSGWSSWVQERSSTSSELNYCYKTSDGTETAVTATWTEGAGRDGQLVIVELSGVQTTPDVTVDANSGGSVVTSQTSGTTGTISGAGIAVGAWSIDTGYNWEVGRAHTNSFTSREWLAPTSESPFHYSAGLSVATKAVTSGTVECTFSTTGSGDQACGAMLVFQDTGGGGGISIPVAMYHYMNH